MRLGNYISAGPDKVESGWVLPFDECQPQIWRDDMVLMRTEDLTQPQIEELKALSLLSDEDIDTSDIPETGR